MPVFLYILLAILISTTIAVALLWITRNRLARQFQDIQRRLIDLERATRSLLPETNSLLLQRDITAAQLQRVHKALVRMQESMAARYGALAPMARDVERRGAEPRYLMDFEIAGLEQWASTLGISLGEREIAEISRALDRVANFGMGEIKIGKCDLPAIFITLLAVQKNYLSVGVGEEMMAAVLRRVAAGYIERVEFLSISSGGIPAQGSLDVLILDREASANDALHWSGFVKPDGLLVQHRDLDDAAPDYSDFQFIAAEWNVAVYRRNASH